MSRIKDWYGKRLTLIAPHPDDIAYSIGGFVSQLAAVSTLEVVTVFTQSRWALPKSLRNSGAAIISKVRVKEEQTFCQNFKMKLYPLGLSDSSLSGYDDGNERQLEFTQGQLTDDIRTSIVLEKLHQVLAESRPDIVIAPAAIGHHIDHQIVHHAICSLQNNQWQLVFYEDLPYAYEFTLDILEKQLTERKLRVLETISIDQTLADKYTALSNYASQTDQETINAIIAHAQRLAQMYFHTGKTVHHAERFWEKICQYQ
ncbi:2'-N-acetylparomamine deacetylase [Xenorhabdus beddingii]|uniref:2'-N-acetylparomamine deacetylase n=1 Tax=Xenorhabdus beddingii TaxID=40578 RepID=A0A1Y2SUE1_9GAMM|nr:PIG-L family deacetylase [Xenorhabdus beddingii]OTA21863.1 2'-N-acetylparomamine deacetylase [Xenorhabdus beddingii]